MRDAGWRQAPLFAPSATGWTPPRIADLPQSWAGVGRVAIDVESRDDDLYALGSGVRRGAYMCGVSFAIEDGPSAYLPFRHEGGGNLDEAQVIAYLQDRAAELEGDVAGNGLQYDLDHLWERKIVFAKARRHLDVQVAEPLLDELQDLYNLDAILRRRGLLGKDEGVLREHADAWGVDAKKHLWRLHSSAVGAYATRDVTGPLELLRRQEREIVDQGLERAFAMESECTLGLLEMTRRGVRVDLAELESVEQWVRETLDDALGRVRHLTGVRIKSPMSVGQLAPALRARGIEVPMVHPLVKGSKRERDTSKPKRESVTKEFLVARAGDEVVDAILEAREFHKMLTTYVAGVRVHLIGDRLHPSIKQMVGAGDDEDSGDSEGARFGRTATRHPNVQAQPVRHPKIGKRWRRIYIPEEDEQWECYDFSQQEPRTTVHYAEACNGGRGLTGARAFGDAYRTNPKTDSHDMFAKISGLPRKNAKEVFLGLCYSMGGGRLAIKLGLPTEWCEGRDGRRYLGPGPEARAILDQFDDRVPFVRELSKLCMQQAERRGYIIAIDGSRCRFPKDAHDNFDWTYKALNRLIQRSAAIQTKTALVHLRRAGYKPRLTVHDEFDFSRPRGLSSREIVEIMAKALPLSVPSRVDVEVGPNYGQLQELVEA